MKSLTYREVERPAPKNQPEVDVNVLLTPIVASPPVALTVDPDINSGLDQMGSAWSGQ